MKSNTDIRHTQTRIFILLLCISSIKNINNLNLNIKYDLSYTNYIRLFYRYKYHYKNGTNIKTINYIDIPNFAIYVLIILYFIFTKIKQTRQAINKDILYSE